MNSYTLKSIRIMKKIIIFVVIVFPFCIQATPYAGEFYNLPYSAAIISAGDAAFFSDMPVSFMIAPANIRNEKMKFISYNHISGFDLYTDDNVIFSMSDSNQGFSIFIKRFGSGNIPITTLTDTTDTIGPNNQPYIDHYTSWNRYFLVLNYVKKINGIASLGVNFKTDYRGFDSHYGLGVGLDAGISFNFLKNIYSSLSVKNISTTVIFWDNGEKEFAYPELNIMMGYSLPLNKNRLNVYTRFPIHFDNRGTADQFDLKYFSMDIQAGIDFYIANYIRLSAGLYQQNPTLGIGGTFRNFYFDYSIFIHNDLGMGNVLTLSYKFR